MTDRHLELVADASPDGMTASVSDVARSAAPALPGAAEPELPTDYSFRGMRIALDALETAMFGGPLTTVRRR